MSQLLPERRAAAGSERWEPLTDLEQVAQRMRRMLEQTFGLEAPVLPTERAGWSPLVDIEETDDAFVVEAELPGVRREDVTVELVGRELSITGETKEPEREGTVRRRSRRIGRFEYRVVLPDQVDPDRIEAGLADGVLRVRIPKSERAERRRIDVTS